MYCMQATPALVGMDIWEAQIVYTCNTVTFMHLIYSSQPR